MGRIHSIQVKVDDHDNHECSGGFWSGDYGDAVGAEGAAKTALHKVVVLGWEKTESKVVYPKQRVSSSKKLQTARYNATATSSNTDLLMDRINDSQVEVAVEVENKVDDCEIDEGICSLSSGDSGNEIGVDGAAENGERERNGLAFGRITEMRFHHRT